MNNIPELYINNFIGVNAIYFSFPEKKTDINFPQNTCRVIAEEFCKYSRVT
jgi:hypothetical protein